MLQLNTILGYRLNDAELQTVRNSAFKWIMLYKRNVEINFEHVKTEISSPSDAVIEENAQLKKDNAEVSQMRQGKIHEDDE